MNSHDATTTKGEVPCYCDNWQAAHSAQYIFEDLNNEEGWQKVADLTGYPLGVIVAAFDNFFPTNNE